MHDPNYTNHETRLMLAYLDRHPSDIKSILEEVYQAGIAQTVRSISLRFSPIENQIRTRSVTQTFDYTRADPVNYWEVVGHLIDRQNRQGRQAWQRSQAQTLRHPLQRLMGRSQSEQG